VLGPDESLAFFAILLDGFSARNFPQSTVPLYNRIRLTKRGFEKRFLFDSALKRKFHFNSVLVGNKGAKKTHDIVIPCN